MHIYVCVHIQQSPHLVQVDVKIKSKTGLIVATAEGQLSVVKTLLEFNASVNEKVLQLCLNCTFL